MANFLALFGFLMAYGAVGGIENDGPLFTLTVIAVAGLALMAVGVNMMNSRGFR
jgi:hypothetical protein